MIRPFFAGRKPGAAPEDVFTLDTITQRMPKIIQSTVAAMPSALKTSDFEQNVKALQDEMKEGAQLRLLRGDSPRVGADRWNEHLTEFIDRGEGWHTAPWWVVENYMYKRLLEDSMPRVCVLSVALCVRLHLSAWLVDCLTVSWEDSVAVSWLKNGPHTEL